MAGNWTNLWGLTHTGSWGLPELGITEMFSGTRNASGGSDNPTTGTSQTVPTSSFTQLPVQGPSGPPAGYVAPTSGDTSGGTSGGTGGQVLGDNNVPQPEDNSAILKAIEDAYNNAMGYASSAEDYIRGLQPGAEQEITDTATLNRNLADTQKAQGERAVASGETESQKRYQSAISLARQIFSESGLGANQRFGRGSNIARALGEYAGTKMQQTAGQANDIRESTINKLAEQKQQIIENYGNVVQQINNWQTTAMNQIKNDFGAKLLEIQGMRTQAESDKQNARIQALQSMNDQINAIKTQAWQYSQEAKTSAASAASNWQDVYNQLVGGQAGAGAIDAAGEAANTTLTQNINPLSFGSSTQDMASNAIQAAQGFMQRFKPKLEDNPLMSGGLVGNNLGL
jgi:hypothetical protein